MPTPISIFVCGPSSSGKTTLCRALSAHLKLPAEVVVEETARKVMRTQGFTRADVPTFAMKHAILTAQLAAEEAAVEAAANSGQMLALSDRSAVDAIVYAEFDPDGEQQKERLLDEESFRRGVVRYRRSLFVLLAPVEEWVVDDGVRSIDRGDEYHGFFVAMLKRLEIPYQHLGQETKGLEERVSQMVAWIDERRHLHEITPGPPLSRHRCSV